MKKSFLVAVAVGWCSFFVMIWSNRFRYIPRVVFCNVGQGDAVYAQLPGNSQILVDTGPDNDMVLRCLDNEMPYFDRTLDAIFITHTQRDHDGGLASVLKNYTTDNLFVSRFQKKIDALPLHAVTLVRGDTVSFAKTQVHVLWPPDNLQAHRTTASETNNLALGLQINSDNQEVLLLSDIDSTEGERALSGIKHQRSILKISHHGSRYGTNERLLLLADPSIAVISVGQKNTYGHPNPLVTNLLKQMNIQTKRTDISGSITVEL